MPQILINKYTIVIQDSGPGFPLDVIKSIGKQIATSTKGSGMGIFLAATLLDSISWEMQISNNKSGAEVLLKRTNKN